MSEGLKVTAAMLRRRDGDREDAFGEVSTTASEGESTDMEENSEGSDPEDEVVVLKSQRKGGPSSRVPASTSKTGALPSTQSSSAVADSRSSSPEGEVIVARRRGRRPTHVVGRPRKKSEVLSEDGESTGGDDVSGDDVDGVRKGLSTPRQAKKRPRRSSSEDASTPGEEGSVESDADPAAATMLIDEDGNDGEG